MLILQGGKPCIPAIYFSRRKLGAIHHLVRSTASRMHNAVMSCKGVPVSAALSAYNSPWLTRQSTIIQTLKGARKHTISAPHPHHHPVDIALPTHPIILYDYICLSPLNHHGYHKFGIPRRARLVRLTAHKDLISKNLTKFHHN